MSRQVDVVQIRPEAKDERLQIEDEKKKREADTLFLASSILLLVLHPQKT